MRHPKNALSAVPKKLWAGVKWAGRTLVRILPIRVIDVMIAVTIIAGTFVLVSHKQQVLDHRQTVTQEREAAGRTYAAAENAYVAQLAVYNACLTRVDGRDDLRTVLFRMVDISDVLPGNDRAVAYTTARIAFINAKFPPLDKSATCQDPPTAPEIPKEMLG